MDNGEGRFEEIKIPEKRFTEIKKMFEKEKQRMEELDARHLVGEQEGDPILGATADGVVLDEFASNPFLAENDNEEIKKEIKRMKEENPNHGGVFRKGEILQIKGSRFRVKTISPKELRLKLLPRRIKIV